MKSNLANRITKVSKLSFPAAFIFLSMGMLNSCSEKNENKQNELSKSQTMSNEYSLLNADQRAVDELALKLMDEPEVNEAREKGVKLWQSLPEWQIPDGKATFEGAVDEAVFLAVRSVAGNDPAFPKVIWTSAPEYSYADLKIPRSCGASDNPDRVYRSIAVDPKYKYVIHGKRAEKPTNKDFSFEALPVITLGDNAKAVLSSKEIDVAEDGTFTITIDATPAGDRKNHLEIPAGTKTVLVRETISDWSNQLPNKLAVERTDDIKATPKTYEQFKGEVSEEIIHTMKAITRYMGYARESGTNDYVPQIRKLDGGLPGTAGAFSRFNLAPDEALVVTINPLSADYVNVQLTDLWIRSIPFREVTSGLSDKQAKHNADGSMTFIISDKDPGYYNWLNTNGLREGFLQVRVEDFDTRPDGPETVIPSPVLVKLSKLENVLPKEMKRVTKLERAKQLAERQKGFDYRTGE